MATRTLQRRNAMDAIHARIKSLALAIASHLVTYPALLRCEVAINIKTVVVELCGHNTDTGSLLGKSCLHKDAIETFIRLVVPEKTVSVRIRDGHTGEKERDVDVPFSNDWKPTDDANLRAAVVSSLGDVLHATVTVQSIGNETTVCIWSAAASKEIEDACNAIFRAWGRRRGRRVRVEVASNERATV